MRTANFPGQGTGPGFWEELLGKGGPRMGRRVGYYTLAIVAVIWLLTGIYIVHPGQEGVVRRFGKKITTKGPGLHYRLPWPADRVDKPKVMEIKRIEIGFRTVYAGPPARYGRILEESLMLTGDENIVDCWMIAQYKIKDSSAYLFNVRDVEGTLRDAAEVALRQVVGDHTIDDVMIAARFKVEEMTREVLQRIMDGYGSGILITAVKLQEVHPPEEVRDSFDNVVRAKEDKDKIINEAKGYYEDIMPKARGKAERLLREAEGYKEERTKRAEGDARKFLLILSEYQKAKTLTEKRLYLETMEEILPGLQKYIVSPEKGGLLNILQLKQEPTALPEARKGEAK